MGEKRINRRKVLMGAALIGGVTLGYSGLVEPASLRVREETLFIPNLPDGYEGFRIAHLTDFHYRPALEERLVRNAVEQAMRFQPDLIALTGDFIERCPLALPRLLTLLSPLNARCGVYAVLGNHDLYALSYPDLREAFSGGNIELLVNEYVERGQESALPVQVIGLDSAYEGMPAYGIKTKEREGKLRILLVHEPDVFPECSSAYDAHLQLSGHTHGGQCRIPLLQMPVITPPYGKIYVDGEYGAGKNRLFVSSGIGTSGFRLRFSCPPEVALLTLRKKQW